MSAARQDLRTFPHRPNPDGTFDSICPKCYRTISRQKRESDLITFERDHVCHEFAFGRVPGRLADRETEVSDEHRTI